MGADLGCLHRLSATTRYEDLTPALFARACPRSLLRARLCAWSGLLTSLSLAFYFVLSPRRLELRLSTTICDTGRSTPICDIRYRRWSSR